MAKGGGFSGGGGGGFKGGGFSGGGFKGFSGGSKPNGTNFSSFRPSGGARPPVNNSSNLHSGSNNSFLLGAILGNVFGNRNNGTTVNVNNGANPNGVFKDEYARTAPQVVLPKPTYREYKKCDYCNTEVTDTSLTKCPSCGANLRYVKEQTNLDATKTDLGSSNSAQPKKKVSTAGVIVLVFAVFVIGLLIFTAMFGGSPVYETHSVGEIVTTQYVKFEVKETSLQSTVGSVLTGGNGKQYYLVRVKISNPDLVNPISIYDGDFKLLVDGNLLTPLNAKGTELESNGGYFTFPFDENGQQQYFVIDANSGVTGYFIYEISSALTNASLVYSEYEDTSDLLGEYTVELIK